VPYWPVLGVSVAYVGVLFVIAWWGDRRAASDSLFPMDSRRAAVGYEFLPIYIGPALLLIFGQPLYAKVLTIAKAQNATSISDFIAARYGKSQTVAALVTLMTLFGVLPYIALQLKAVGVSFDVLTARSQMAAQMDVPFWEDTSFAVAAAMAVFTIVFGVRHIHASEHHRGLMLAIAFEGLVKLSAFIAVGLFIVYGMFDGFTDLYARASANPDLHRLTEIDLSHANWYSVAIVSTICFVCLPQAFHVTAVENENPRHMRPAAWLYPAYLAILSVFMVPIAIAGLTTFGDRVNPDTYVINLPISADAGAISLFAFIGGFSAATGMVIVAGVSLSTMICNDVVMPVLLNLAARRRRDISRVLLLVRRTAVLVILLLAYVMYRTVDQSYPLTEIGLMSFVAVAQFGPASSAASTGGGPAGPERSRA
jgi:Na+/proline symporter